MGLRRFKRRTAERWARVATWIEQSYDVKPTDCFVESRPARIAIAASAQVWLQCDRLLISQNRRWKWWPRKGREHLIVQLSDQGLSSIELLLRSSAKVSDVGVLSRILVEDRFLEYSFARLFAEFCRHRLWMLAPYLDAEKAALRKTLHHIGFYEVVSWEFPLRNPPIQMDRTIGWQSSGEFLTHSSANLDPERQPAPQLWCASRWPIVDSSAFARRGLPSPWLPAARP